MIKKIILYIIWFYQKAFSIHLRPMCRYYPTCSNYAEEAVKRYGAWKGSYMAFRRIIRCHPFHEGGYDPVH